jgi:amidophosphoribosyltransferase
MCGIVGIINSNTKEYVSGDLIIGLNMLQHRGQDSTGIYTLNNNIFHSHKNLGLVGQVYNSENLLQLKGNIGIGHVRYSTAGSINMEQTQPLYTSFPYGIALVHNGNITNSENIRKELVLENRHVNSDSDSEVLLNLFANELNNLNNVMKNQHIDTEHKYIFEVVKSVFKKCKGGYSVIIIINNVGMVAFRDPYGIRPLSLGTRKNKWNITTLGGTGLYGPKDASGENDYIFASENIAIDKTYSSVRNVLPGECIFINTKYEIYNKVLIDKPILSPCLFEYIYFARPDSQIDGILVYEARIRMGMCLGRKIKRLIETKENNDLSNIDVVIPVPETSRSAALYVAQEIAKPFREGFIKNNYISRTFIMPDQESRIKNISLKLNTISSEFIGKNVLIVDDSIVRGNTSKQLVQLARESGAKKIYFASLAPPVKYSNKYGIAIPTKKELIAYKKTDIEIAETLGADFVIYNDLENVIEICKELNPKIDSFETSCFDGKYVN